MLLAGDVGGTKTSLAIYSPEEGPAAPHASATLHSADYPSLETLVQDFLQGTNLTVDRASFGVAGPVVAGTAKITNLPWLMDERHLAAALHLSSVRLLNDLEAVAHAVPALKAGDLFTINEGQPVKKGPRAIVAPGTGLGEAFLVWSGRRYRICASEGGHADFAPVDELQRGLLAYLADQYDHVSFERVCSGRGLPNIYAYLKDSGYAQEPGWLTEELNSAPDPSPVIVKAALEHDCELCTATLDLFVSILGAQAGNMALTVLATGGVYLGGGIPPRIVSTLAGGRFMEAFLRKGRFGDLLRNVPVHVILNPGVALMGAARHGLETVPD